jgi:hypothetical protein
VSGRGGVLIHLSQRALQHSSGAPLSFVSQVRKNKKKKKRRK